MINNLNFIEKSMVNVRGVGNKIQATLVLRRPANHVPEFPGFWGFANYKIVSKVPQKY